MNKTPCAALALVFALTAARESLAKSQFPRQIQQDLGLGYAPACTLCHENGATGPATVKTPFGLSAMARGLNASDRNSVETSIAQMQIDQVDSDGDGVSDVDELKAGTDPNTAAKTSLADYPAGGCCAQPRTAGRGAAPTAIWVAGAVVVALRRKRRGK